MSDIEKYIQDQPDLLRLFRKLKKLNSTVSRYYLERFERLVSTPDLYSDRWERARLYNWGENTNLYDNVLVLGDVTVGKECWIGPNVILDGSGDLQIGDFCTISAGVQIYTHDNIESTLSSKEKPIARAPVTIGNNVYIGPNAVVAKGVTIGNRVVVGAFSLVSSDVSDDKTVYGQPAK